MKLNWFSPLPPEQTDIAHYTARIAAALMRRFDVTFWTDLAADPKALPPEAKVRVFDPAKMTGRKFNGPLFNGLNVYNIGNDARFHRGIVQVARKIPGLAILHDTRLHHLVFESARNNERPFSSYIDLAREIYGPGGEAKAQKIVMAEGRTIDEHVDDMPFVEAFLENAIGALCHSKLASDDLRRCSTAPVLTLPLPFTSLARPPETHRQWSAPWRFVMFGYVNPNRRLENILQALATWRDAPDFHFDVFGSLWNRPLIEKRIAESGLKARVTIHGFVPERQLDKAIASAHLAFNLRYPSMGEASGGILRSWAHATPALVTNTGWYADLPDEVARKLSVDEEIADIHKALNELVASPERYEQTGVAARNRLETLHSPDAYASALAAALENLPRLMTRFASRRLMLNVAMNAKSREERSPLLQVASERIPDLFIGA